MKKYEYQQINYSNYPSPEELNEEGIDGWELIHILPTEKEYYFSKIIYVVTFKREI